MNRSVFTSTLPLVGAAGFAAMCVGHALVQALGPSTGYRHGVQGPALELAALLALFAAGSIVKRIAATLHRAQDVRPDWALPALAAIRELGIVRVAAAVTTWQLVSLVAGEALEQRAAGVTIAGMAGIVGSPLALAPLIHVLIGVAAGSLLWLCARTASHHVRSVIALVRVVLGWAQPKRNRSAHARLAPFAALPFARDLLSAHRLESRPPPPSLRLA